jgi:hypothetical protein
MQAHIPALIPQKTNSSPLSASDPQSHEVEVEVNLRLTSQSASLSWCQAPIWDLWPIFLSPWNFLWTAAALLFRSSLSDERTGGSSSVAYLSDAMDMFAILMPSNSGLLWLLSSLSSVVLKFVWHQLPWFFYCCLHFFLNPILFAICTSTFSKLCVTYTLTCRIELSSAPL